MVLLNANAQAEQVAAGVRDQAQHALGVKKREEF